MLVGEPIATVNWCKDDTAQPKMQGVTHPETFIRAKAVSLWVQEPQRAATEIGQIIQGPPAISELDFQGQVRTLALTRRLIGAFLRPNWLRTDPMLAHARLFFDDFAVEPAADAALTADLRAGDAKMHDYYCYVLLDFAVADRDLEEAPLAAALILGDDLGLGGRFRQHPGTHRAGWHGRDRRICEPGKNP